MKIRIYDGKMDVFSGEIGRGMTGDWSKHASFKVWTESFFSMQVLHIA